MGRRRGDRRRAARPSAAGTPPRPQTGRRTTAAVPALGCRGSGTGLSSLATDLEEAIRSRCDIEADRAEPRATARNPILITLTVMLGLRLLLASFLEPYHTTFGQLLLAGIVGIGGLTIQASAGSAGTMGPSLARRRVLPVLDYGARAPLTRRDDDQVSITITNVRVKSLVVPPDCQDLVDGAARGERRGRVGGLLPEPQHHLRMPGPGHERA